MMHERTGYSVLREIKQAQTNDYSVADVIPNLLKKIGVSPERTPGDASII